jgi:hypothetical protein
MEFQENQTNVKFINKNNAESISFVKPVESINYKYTKSESIGNEDIKFINYASKKPAVYARKNIYDNVEPINISPVLVSQSGLNLNSNSFNVSPIARSDSYQMTLAPIHLQNNADLSELYTYVLGQSQQYGMQPETGARIYLDYLNTQLVLIDLNRNSIQILRFVDLLIAHNYNLVQIINKLFVTKFSLDFRDNIASPQQRQIREFARNSQQILFITKAACTTHLNASQMNELVSLIKNGFDDPIIEARLSLQFYNCTLFTNEVFKILSAHYDLFDKLIDESSHSMAYRASETMKKSIDIYIRHYLVSDTNRDIFKLLHTNETYGIELLDVDIVAQSGGNFLKNFGKIIAPDVNSVVEKSNLALDKINGMFEGPTADLVSALKDEFTAYIELLKNDVSSKHPNLSDTEINKIFVSEFKTHLLNDIKSEVDRSVDKATSSFLDKHPVLSTLLLSAQNGLSTLMEFLKDVISDPKAVTMVLGFLLFCLKMIYPDEPLVNKIILIGAPFLVGYNIYSFMTTKEESEEEEIPVSTSSMKDDIVPQLISQSAFSEAMNFRIEMFSYFIKTFPEYFKNFDFLKKLPELLTKLGKIGNALAGIEKLIAFVKYAVDWIYGHIARHVFSKEVAPLWSSYNTVLDDFNKTVADILNKDARKELVPDINLLLKVENLITTADELVLELVRSKGHSSMTNRLNFYLNKLRDLQHTVADRVGSSSNFRVLPVWINLCGGPGTGKTQSKLMLQNSIMKSMLDETNYKEYQINSKKYVYEAPVTQNFWDDYQNSVQVLGVTELMAVRSVVGGDPSPMTQMLSLVDTNPCPLKVADMRSFGNKLFGAKVIISTTNSKSVGDDQLLTNSALHRRVFLNLTPVPHPEICNEHGVIDSEKIAIIYGEGSNEAMPNLYKFKRSLPGDTENMQIGELLTLREVHDLILQKMEENDLKHKNFKESVENLGDYFNQKQPETKIVDPDIVPPFVEEKDVKCYKILKSHYDSLVGAITPHIHFQAYYDRTKHHFVQFNAMAEKEFMQAVKKMGILKFKTNIDSGLVKFDLDSIVASLKSKVAYLIDKLKMVIPYLGAMAGLGGILYAYRNFGSIKTDVTIRYKNFWNRIHASNIKKLNLFLENNPDIPEQQRNYINEVIVANRVASEANVMELDRLLLETQGSKETAREKWERVELRGYSRGNKKSSHRYDKGNHDNWRDHEDYNVADYRTQSGFNKTTIGPILNNIYKFVCRGETCGFATFIGEKTIMFNHHFIRDIKLQLVEDCGIDPEEIMVDFVSVEKETNIYTVSFKDILRDCDSMLYHCDVAFLTIPKARPHKNIVEQFASKASIEALARSANENISVRFHHYEGDVLRDRCRMESAVETSDGVKCLTNLMYRIPTKTGDCGILTSIVGGPCNGKFLAFHWAGDNKGSSIGYGSLISRESLRDKLNPQPNIELPYSNELVTQGIYGYWKDTKTVYSSRRTEFYETPLHSHPLRTWPVTNCPARLKPFNLDGVELDPFLEGLKRRRPNVANYDPIIATLAMEEVFSYLIGQSRNVNHRRILTFEEAVGGISPYFKGIARDKSTGYPYALHTPYTKKHMIFGTKGPYLFDTKPALQVRAEVEKIIDLASKGIRSLHVYTDCMKDETVSLKKYDVGKTRVFAISPMALTIATRMYFGSFMIFCVENKIDNDFAVGVNPFGLDWKRVADTFTTHASPDSCNFGAGDYKGFDFSQRPEFLKLILACMNDYFYSTFDHDPVEDKIREILFMEVWDSYYMYQDKIYKSYCSMPSGGAMTTIINCIYNKFAFNYSWLRLHEGDLSSFSEMRKNFKCLIYGDDNIFVLTNAYTTVFSEAIHAKYAEELGLIYTTDLKETAGNYLRTMDAITFLKRSFRFCDGDVLAPKELGSILETLMWRGKSANAVFDTADDQILELSLHCQAVFDKYVKIIRSVYAVDLKQQDKYSTTQAKARRRELPWL